MVWSMSGVVAAKPIIVTGNRNRGGVVGFRPYQQVHPIELA
jgi:hypothetical protein